MSIKVQNAPKKAKSGSKKTKKGWRKNVDITQEEEFLEDQRLEERLGGAFNERADEELFVIDNKAEEVIEEPAKKWRKKREEKPLKCFQHLELKSGAKDPVKVRNRRKTELERKNPLVIAKEKKLAENGIVKAKTKLQKEHRELERLKKESQKLERTTRRRTQFDFDLWDQNPNEDKKKIESDEWLDDQTKNYIMKNTRNFTRKLPKDRHEKPSDLAPVEPPHAGLSYNPSLKDHQDLLWKAAVVEMNKERADRKIEYHTTRMFPDRKDAPTAKSWVKEMSEGIPELDENAAQPDEEEPQGNFSIMIPFLKI